MVMYDIFLKTEFNILELISSVRCDFLDEIMVFISALADKGAIWIMLSVVLLIFKKTRRIGICVSLALIINFLLVNVITKPLIHRTRPYDINTDIKLIVPALHDFSFPSGHTSASFSASLALCGYSRKWGIACIVLSFLIAFSRLYLCVHFPTDVLFGCLFGVLSAYIAKFICKKSGKLS